MPKFGVIEGNSISEQEQQGRALHQSVEGDVLIQQGRDGGDAVIFLTAYIRDDKIDALKLLITKAFGNPPIPEIGLSVKHDKDGRVYKNGQEKGITTVKVDSGSLVIFRRDDI